MDNLAWVAIGLSALNTAVLFVGRSWTASRTFVAKDDYDEDMVNLKADVKDAREIIHRRIDAEHAHNMRQDTSIHEGQLNYMELKGLIESFRDCVKELKLTVREMRNMPHTPQCQVATHTPERPVGLTGRHNFTDSRQPTPSDSDIKHVSDYVRQERERHKREREQREGQNNDAMLMSILFSEITTTYVQVK